MARALPCSLTSIAHGDVQLEQRGQTGNVEVNVGLNGAISFPLIESQVDEWTFREGSDLRWPGVLVSLRRVIDGQR